MQNYFKQYWPVFLSVVSLFVSIVTQWAIIGYRINAVELTQEQQSGAIVNLQQQLSAQAAQYAGLSAKLDSIKDNVTYIRSRIDTVANQ